MNNNIVEVVKAKLRAKKETENKDNDTVKVSDTPQEMTPLQREEARRRKIANKYDSYITNKLLPSLDK